MKRAISLVLIVVTGILSVVGCGQKAPTWQEQYDLGVRYLSEGNYEEAIIAFTAAIEIDSKQVLAYVGRGNAYVLSGETEENLGSAQADYEQAIELDKTYVEAYLGLADVYIRQGNYDKAIELLQQGLERTEEDQDIATKLAELLENYSSQKETGNQPSEENGVSVSIPAENPILGDWGTYRPQYTASVPFEYSVICNDGIQPDIKIAFHAGENTGWSAASSNGIRTILFGGLYVKINGWSDGGDYIWLGTGVSGPDCWETDLEQYCPDIYMNSAWYKAREDQLSFDEIYNREKMGWNRYTGGSSLKGNTWYTGVAAYDESGNRVGYTVYELVSSQEFIAAKEACTVVVNEEDGQIIE